MSDKGRETEEEKGSKESSIQFSRRGFLKGLGTGAASVAITGMPLILPPEAEAALPSGAKEAVVQLNVNNRAYRVKVKSH